MTKINWRKIWRDFENWENEFLNYTKSWVCRKRKIRQLVEKQLKLKS